MLVVVLVLENPDRFAIRLTEQISCRTSGSLRSRNPNAPRTSTTTRTRTIPNLVFKHVGRSQLLGNTPQHHRFSGLDCSRFADDERSEPKPVADPQPNTAVQKLTLARLRSLGLEPLRGSYRLHSARKPWGTVSHIIVTSLRSKGL